MSVAPVGIVVLIVISLLFKQTLKLWFKLAVFLLHTLKWLIIVGLLFGFANTPQMHSAMGCTPVSMVFGDKVYEHNKRQEDTKKKRGDIHAKKRQH